MNSFFTKIGGVSPLQMRAKLLRSEKDRNERLDHPGIVAGVCQEIGLKEYVKNSQAKYPDPVGTLLP
jgi:hypothetical protein